MCEPQAPLQVPENFTHTWNIGFMSGALSNGAKFRSLHVPDNHKREALFLLKLIIRSKAAVWFGYSTT
ncbi:hypothetical protein [Rhodoflexus sp.]